MAAMRAQMAAMGAQMAAARMGWPLQQLRGAGIELWQLPAAAAEEFSHSGQKGSDVASPALHAALAAIRTMLASSSGAPAVVFDGLHADDFPPSTPQVRCVL